MADLGQRLHRLARGPSRPPDLDGAWARGRRRRTAKRAGTGVALAALVVAGVALADLRAQPEGLEVTTPSGLTESDLAAGFERVDDVISGPGGTWLADYAASRVGRIGSDDSKLVAVPDEGRFCGFEASELGGTVHRECRADGDRFVLADATELALSSTGPAVWDGRFAWATVGRSTLVALSRTGSEITSVDLSGVVIELAPRHGTGGALVVVRADGRSYLVVLDRDGAILEEVELVDLRRGAVAAWSGDRAWVLDVAGGRLWSLSDEGLILESAALPAGRTAELVATPTCVAALLDETLVTRDVTTVLRVHEELPGARRVAIDGDRVLVARADAGLSLVGC